MNRLCSVMLKSFIVSYLARIRIEDGAQFKDRFEIGPTKSQTAAN